MPNFRIITAGAIVPAVLLAPVMAVSSAQIETASYGTAGEPVPFWQTVETSRHVRVVRNNRRAPTIAPKNFSVTADGAADPPMPRPRPPEAPAATIQIDDQFADGATTDVALSGKVERIDLPPIDATERAIDRSQDGVSASDVAETDSQLRTIIDADTETNLPSRDATQIISSAKVEMIDLPPINALLQTSGTLRNAASTDRVVDSNPPSRPAADAMAKSNYALSMSQARGSGAATSRSQPGFLQVLALLGGAVVASFVAWFLFPRSRECRLAGALSSASAGTITMPPSE